MVHAFTEPIISRILLRTLMENKINGFIYIDRYDPSFYSQDPSYKRKTAPKTSQPTQAPLTKQEMKLAALAGQFCILHHF